MKMSNYYKISIHTERGKALTEFMRQCRDAEMKADAWAANHHAKEFIEPPVTFAGGVLALMFKDGYQHNPDTWRPITTDDGVTCYVPNVPDDFDPAAARSRVEHGATISPAEQLELSRLALPTMSVGHLFDVLPYKAAPGQRISLRVSPMVFRRNSFWYVGTPIELADNADLDIISEKTFYRNRMSLVNES